MSQNHKLEADSIRKSYGNRTVLSDVYISCSTNDIVGLVGRNGAGKSTLLRIIFGELKAQNGTIRIDGKYLGSPYRSSGTIAYLPQESMLPLFTPIKRIINSFVPENSRSDILSDIRIKHHINKKISQISGGERKYLEARMILSLRRKFLLIDEPFNGIEPIYKEIIIELLNSVKDSTGIIISDHDYRNVIGVSNRLFLISDGVCKEIKDLNELELKYYLPKGKVEFERLNLLEKQK